MAVKDDSLLAFLAENAIKADTVEYVASKRFVKDGKPVAWKITPITSDTNTELLKACRKKQVNPATKEVTITTDNIAYTESLVAECVTFPNLNNADLQASYNAVGAVDLVKKMLLPAEYNDLLFAVQEANGFESGMADKVKRAKN